LEHAILKSIDGPTTVRPLLEPIGNISPAEDGKRFYAMLCDDNRNATWSVVGSVSCEQPVF